MGRKIVHWAHAGTRVTPPVNSKGVPKGVQKHHKRKTLGYTYQGKFNYPKMKLFKQSLFSLLTLKVNLKINFK